MVAVVRLREISGQCEKLGSIVLGGETPRTTTRPCRNQMKSMHRDDGSGSWMCSRDL